MKKYISVLSLGLVALVATGCKKDNAEYSVNRDRAYIEQSQTRGNTTGRLQVAEDEPEGRTAAVNVRLSDRQSSDRKFRLRLLTQAELDQYNQENGVEYYMLPQENFQLSSQEVVVKAGQVKSEDVSLRVLPFSPQLQATGNLYVVPFKLESVDGMSTILGGNEYIYKVKPTEITSAPVLGTDMGNEGATNGFRNARNLRMFRATGGTKAELTKWTFECRINMSGFSRNNQMLFNHSGGDGEIYIRFGDAPTPYNSLNIKVGGAQIDRSETLFQPHTWYHIAIVYDGTNVTLYVNGKKDTAIDKIAGKVFTLGSNISMGNWYQYSNEMFINRAMVSEVRFWSVARSADELVEYEYSVSPKSKGLLHYWRMNEGQGRELKNSVEGQPSMFVVGYDQTNAREVEATTRWMTGVRSDDKTITRITTGNAPALN